MTVLQEILKWSKTIPNWQSDVIARLLHSPEITPEQLDEIYNLLKSSHGLEVNNKTQLNPLRDDQIPAVINNKDIVILQSIQNIKGANALAENKTLSLQEHGLTVIYGDNGSGKSGYSRILKRACRARDQSEAILPNLNNTSSGSSKATATFELLINGKATTINWVDGEPSPEILSSISIFDSRCARAYLDEENDFSYVPYGLEIFEGLAKICSQLETMVWYGLSFLNTF